KVDVVDGDRSAGKDLRQSDEVEPCLTGRGGGACRPPGFGPLLLHALPLGGQEVVHGLDEVDALARIRVPGGVLADALLERAALASLALLDVADLARAAR